MLMTKGMAVDPAVSAELKELRQGKKACEQLESERSAFIEQQPEDCPVIAFPGSIPVAITAG